MMGQRTIGTDLSQQKFKPAAKPLQAFPAPCLSPLAITKTHCSLTPVSAVIIPMLADDGSPAVRKNPSRPLSPVRTPQKRAQPVIDLSSPEPPSSSAPSVPRKRQSSEAPGVFDPVSSVSKRTKRANKENHFDAERHAEDDVDMSDFGEPSTLLSARSRSREPATPRRRKREIPQQVNGTKPGMSHVDLDDVSQVSLRC
jgi:hypothetical protein